MINLDRVLIVSHEDYEPYASVLVEFDYQKNFNVVLEYSYSEDASLNHKTTAVIHKDNAYALAKRLKINLLELPDYFAKKFDRDSFFNDVSDVEALFAEVIDFLLDEGITYRIK